MGCVIISATNCSTRVVVVGVCMQTDAFEPSTGIMKEVDLRFVLGYTPRWYAQSLRAIAKGHLDVAPIIQQVIDINKFSYAFNAL